MKFRISTICTNSSTIARQCSFIATNTSWWIWGQEITTKSTGQWQISRNLLILLRWCTVEQEKDGVWWFHRRITPRNIDTDGCVGDFSFFWYCCLCLAHILLSFFRQLRYIVRGSDSGVRRAKERWSFSGNAHPLSGPDFWSRDHWRFELEYISFTKAWLVIFKTLIIVQSFRPFVLQWTAAFLC